MGYNALDLDPTYYQVNLRPRTSILGVFFFFFLGTKVFFKLVFLDQLHSNSFG